jgi:hypothetical protein
MIPSVDWSMSSAAKVLWKFSDNMIKTITSQSEELQRRQEHAPGCSYPLSIGFEPASAPRAIVSTWTQELFVKRMITAATNAKEIRVRSVQSLFAIDQTA